jgi:hypothetical protein
MADREFIQPPQLRSKDRYPLHLSPESSRKPGRSTWTHTGQGRQQVEQRQQQLADTTMMRNKPYRKWAYAFLMAGVDVDSPSYMGILYNILISAETLKGTKADIIVLVQMANTSNSTTLRKVEELWLTSMNVKIQYLDRVHQQSFYTIQYEKFNILDLTQYSRVIFMDGDVMPYCPMDYIFELSEPDDTGTDNMDPNQNHTHPYSTTTPLLKENLIVAWSLEPAHGGFFMLQPQVGDAQLLRAIIAKREDESTTMTSSNEVKHTFDRVKGWGHVITEPDHWHSISGWEGPNATFWKWHGDYADQGLLYFWTKYYKRSVSIVIKDQIENWSSRDDDNNANGQPYLEEVIPDGFLTSYSCLPEQHVRRGKYAKSRFNSRYTPLRDFRHFSGASKPWGDVSKIDWNKTYTYENVQNTDAQHYWFYMLRTLNGRLHLGLDDVSNLRVADSLYGEYPTPLMVEQLVKARRTQQ